MPRDHHHDYRSICIYHITISKLNGIPDFGSLLGEPENVIVSRSFLGMVIENNIRNFKRFHPDIHPYQYAIMPDHVHFILHVKAYLPKPLGCYIGAMKVRIRQQLRAERNIDLQIFAEDFHDRIIRPTHSLQTIFDYIRSNPYRLAIRRKYPDYFRRVADFPIAGQRWQLYGNLHLIQNPFKEQVIVHRKDRETTKCTNRNNWLHAAANGGVLVSPFISPAEKCIRMEAERLHGKIILLTNEPFGNKYKPTAHNFSLCQEGRLLIIAPIVPLPPKKETFMYLNSISAVIATGNY